MKKRSFLERLSGSHPSDDDFDFDDDFQQAPGTKRVLTPSASDAPRHASTVHEERPEGHLPVDMYQSPTDIIIRTFVAGVRPEEMNVSISRDMVVIEGSREERSEASGPDYFSQELFWGSFARTIMLPQEIDVDGATAASKDGLLTITLPKMDKTRQTKLRVKNG